MSIPTNITEGCGQDGWREHARYLGVAVGSAVELEYLLIFARDLGELPAAEADALIAETIATRRMVHALRARILAVHEGAGASVTRH
jgi:four helix bundle protein